MIEACIAMTTFNSERDAKKIAAILVEDRLAACVQIVPKIESIYRWEGQIHDDIEYLLLIKTTEKLIDDVRKSIVKNSNYEVPEFLVVPTIDGLDKYLKWMKDVTK